MAYVPFATDRYFLRVRRFILADGERFVTVVDEAGAPAYYPTALALTRRSHGHSSETMGAEATDLVHLGLWAVRERIDLNARLEGGAYFDLVEIETLAEACGLKTASLRRIALPSVTEMRRGVAMSKTDIVSNALKCRRLSTAARYFDFVGRMSEAHLRKRSLELAERISARKDMAAHIAVHQPRIQSSRIRSIVKAADLARVAAFVATGDPFDVWKTEAMARRNWALVCLLVASGIRQGEARQLKPKDIDLAACEIRVERRHDDPEDPRTREPNAKTLDRIVPFGPTVARALEDYMLGPGSDAAEKRGSPFIFLSHDNHTHGTPISDRTVGRVVHELGKHLGIEGLTPHHLRHGWIQNLADWAIAARISAEDFARFANFLGGWSYLSKMAAEYRGDHLTEAAFKAGLRVQESRS
ncbi:tyrosine-type recombinase/integrase [Cereibacter azotoformans]|uniref:Phage integrase family protein n=1 Tax=Cereibacter azotoformans TaxID=43057 RepID=A0A2T5K9R4_9RHOB|nr:tyrosine-type recombinase/integrase [Cereibacter azotoformans]PTR19161.1 phage integrase family protein [Cereibacter azotoformans]UIJ32371.1 tyrosine-type recombinase/integrase [Cereibacter azotoformans]